MRKQFTFYASFWEAISRIKDPVVRAEAYDVICNYAINGEQPDLDDLSDAAAIAFAMAKPNLDASKRKADAGKRGGKASNEEANRSKPEANESNVEANSSKSEASAKQIEASSKQSGSKHEQGASKKENEKENEGENKIENECSPPTPSLLDYGFSEELRAAVEEWLTYKKERRESYKPMGLKSLLTQISKAASEHGDADVIAIIRQSMSSNYQGIVFDRLTKGGYRNDTSRNSSQSGQPRRAWGITYDT